MRHVSILGIAGALAIAMGALAGAGAPCGSAAAPPSAAPPFPPGIGWVTVCDGMLPEGTDGAAVRALAIPGGADALVVGGPGSISVLKFKDRTSWEVVTRVNCAGRGHVAWSAGNALNNKGGQLVVYADGAFSAYDIGASVQVYTHEIPDTMLAIGIGDADGDGANELVSVCAARAPARDASACRLVVSRLDAAGHTILWEDRGAFGISRPEEGGGALAVHVADLLNDGAVRVVVEETQPDVAPSRYLFFAWKDGALEKDQALSFDRISVRLAECAAGSRTIEYFLVGPIAPRTAGGVQFIGTLIDPSGNGGVFVMRIESLEIAIQEKLVDDWMVGSAAWANLDGAGIGIVRVRQAAGYPRAQYSFYRRIADATR